MEPYGEGLQSDLSPEWSAQGGETGLEESVWQLGFGGDDSYPERPDLADCMHYLRTGFCGYGSRCRFNHPRDRGAVIGATKAGGEYPERVGQPVCQYYMRTKTCKFGVSCKYDHPRQGITSVNPASLSYFGYPLRPGEKECSYYVKTGKCKFGATCKFHHPVPGGVNIQAPSPAATQFPHVSAHIPAGQFQPPIPTSAVYSTLQSPSQQYGVVVARSHLLPGSYVQGPYGPMLLSPPGMVPGWSPYPTSMNPVQSPGTTTQPAVGSSAMYGMAPLSPSTPVYTATFSPLPSSAGTSISLKEDTFPNRPGQAECQYYIKTGDCKFGSSCRYHHPTEAVAPKTNVVLSSVGLPLRAGAPPCTHYTQRGVCKFGPACKFDHPMGTLSYSPSASSLADMPIAPYPVGSIVGTLAPSSSSSDLRPDLNSGTSKDSSSARIPPSSLSASSRPTSSFSKSGLAPQSSMQHSGPSSTPVTGSGDSSSSSVTETLTSNEA